MIYNDVETALAALRTLEEKLAAYSHAMGVLYYDAATVAPKGTYDGRGRTMAVLSQAEYELISSPENDALLSFLEEHADELDEQANREVFLIRKQYKRLSLIPADEYVEYTVLLNEAQSVWEKAKNDNDYALFEPYLAKIVEKNRKFAGYYDSEKLPYDALLNEYEQGMNMEILDLFFEKLRLAIVPLIEKIGKAKQPDVSFLNNEFPKAAQEELSDYLMSVMGINRDYCGIGESEHPFTTNFNNKDVRITTHYYTDNIASSMYSVIHEGGHALYELGVADSLNYTAASGGVSMGIHESQSRFYENIIGRSKEFISFIYPKIKALFASQLEGVDSDSFYRAVNTVTPSLIRTESDELTYSLHVMVRYELEKRLIDGTLDTKDVPAEWNRLYKEYLGVEVPDDKQGCLQDSHWSGGGFGYFPSYALGSAYGAQMLYKMKQDITDYDKKLAEGNLSEITGWLKEKIHHYGSVKEPNEIFEAACGKFDAEYYIEYLNEKFSKLYDLTE